MFKVLLSVLMLLGLGHLYYQYTGNFRAEYVLSAGIYDLPQDLPPLDEKKRKDLRLRLNQAFYYVGHGHQTFVFIGEDGETVLKLFMKEFVRSDWIRYLFPPLPPLRALMLHEGERHQFRLRRLLNGYTLAYTLDPDHCGLLYLHVDQTLPAARTTIVDAFGNRQHVALERMVFALQKKATVTKKVLSQFLSEGDIKGAKEKINQILTLYREQYEKGLVDRDRNFLENTGFIDGRAVRIDVGKVIAHEGVYVLAEEYDKIINKRLILWIKKYYPEYNYIFKNENSVIF